MPSDEGFTGDHGPGLTPDQIREANRLLKHDLAVYASLPHGLVGNEHDDHLQGIIDADAARRADMAAANVAPRAQEMRNRQLGATLATQAHNDGGYAGYQDRQVQEAIAESHTEPASLRTGGQSSSAAVKAIAAAVFAEVHLSGRRLPAGSHGVVGGDDTSRRQVDADMDAWRAAGKPDSQYAREWMDEHPNWSTDPQYDRNQGGHLPWEAPPVTPYVSPPRIRHGSADAQERQAEGPGGFAGGFGGGVVRNDPGTNEPPLIVPESGSGSWLKSPNRKTTGGSAY